MDALWYERVMNAGIMDLNNNTGRNIIAYIIIVNTAGTVPLFWAYTLCHYGHLHGHGHQYEYNRHWGEHEHFQIHLNNMDIRCML